MRIARLDHFVLTAADIDATLDFYTRVLGMQDVTVDGRYAVAFGSSKINLHPLGAELSPRARLATPGSADVCLVTEDTIDAVMAELAAAGVPVELGPVRRAGAVGGMTSCYLRDPDGNLVELSHY
jgi:catechol 2,3-dioxygenase-like lactoylglutathione lyase family enzyme